MSYYKKYLKYKSKYNNLKNQSGGVNIYPAMDYIDVYAAEVKDPLHRPSSHSNNFNDSVNTSLTSSVNLLSLRFKLFNFASS